MITLPPLSTSYEESMVITSASEIMTIKDIAIGEVWLAGGQSNMEFCMRYEKFRDEVIKNCTNNGLRSYDVPEISYDGQLDDFDYSLMGVWRKANPENLDYFSAVGYYFQKALGEVLDVPIGIIGCNWGGTTACAWMNEETVAKVGPEWKNMVETRLASRNMDEYWASQKLNPMNNRGNLFDPLSEIVMPRTPSMEELAPLFANMPENYAEIMETMVDPKSIPGSLYEHMLKEVSLYTIRGFLWYQGESDDDVPGFNVLYHDMLIALISDWRTLWGEELPFLIVQLPGFERWAINPVVNHYQVIRQAQEEVTAEVSNTYMCSISDIGEQFDIHPKNKRDVGKRLALLARNHVYGEEVLCDAPTVASAKREKDRVIITFHNVGKGLLINGDKLQAMVISPVESINAVIEDSTNVESLDYVAIADGNHLIISIDHMPAGPIAVAFAKTMWYQVNLYNEAHIPAIPFSIVIE